MRKQSKFAQNLLENKHPIGPMENNKEAIHITIKVRTIDTLEGYYIFHKTKLKYRINDKLTVKPNIILKTIFHKYPHRGLSAA
jgi:hypothetical protein